MNKYAYLIKDREKTTETKNTKKTKTKNKKNNKTKKKENKKDRIKHNRLLREGGLADDEAKGWHSLSIGQ